MKKPLSTLQRVPLREAWKHEANDFTPWLAESENLNMLADVLHLGSLELVATEHWVGDFKLDILCTNGDDQVIIENQLEKTNHSHLGQIITYAAGIGAKKVIWVAESFRPEHVAALEFLNQNTTDDLSFFAVELELWCIGDSPFAPKFEVVARPNDWVKSGREQARVAVTSTPTKQRLLKFWGALTSYIAAHAPKHSSAETPAPALAEQLHWSFRVWIESHCQPQRAAIGRRAVYSPSRVKESLPSFIGTERCHRGEARLQTRLAGTPRRPLMPNSGMAS